MKITLNFIKSLRNSQDKTVQNFVDSLDEVAVTEYEGMTSNLMDDLINGKLADEIEEEIFAKIASKTAGVDPNLLNVLPERDIIHSLYDNTSSYYTQYDISSLKKMAENPEELEQLKKYNGSIQSTISRLPKGPFRTQLQKSWDEQLEYFNKNIIGKVFL